MRRAVLPLVLVVSALYASAALAGPTTASYSLRIDAALRGSHTVVTGTGWIDDTKRLSSFDFHDSGLALTAVIVSSPEFVVYERRANHPSDPWSGPIMIDDSGPLMDPGLALRLTSFPRRAVGSARMDGVQTTKYTVTVPYPEAQLFTPSLLTPISGAPTVTAWIDAAGAVHRVHAVVTVGPTTTTIDERLGAFGAAVRLSRPRTSSLFEPPLRASVAESVLDYTVVDVEIWVNDHKSYAGMTTHALRLQDPVLAPEATVVRSSPTTYCIQATVSGITAHQNGPKAPYASGPC